jgi:hypothetical protein
MLKQIVIGTWIESEPRIITKSTAYAADYIDHEVVPGEYPVYLEYEITDAVWHSATIVRAKELVVKLPTNIVDGKLFSGFGGVNYGSRDVEQRPSEIVVRPYYYHARELVNDGTLVLDDEFWFLADPLDRLFKEYIETVSVGLYRYLGLDPYFYATSPQFANQLREVVVKMNNDGDWNGYDISVITDAKKLNFVYSGLGGKDDVRIHYSFQGAKFIQEWADQEV